MGKRTERAAGFFSLALAVTAAACVFLRIPDRAGQRTAVTAAGFILPGGAAEAIGDRFFSEEEEEDASAPMLPPVSSASGASSAPGSASSAPQSSSPASSSAASSPASSAPAVSLPGNILETSLATGGIQYQNIWVKNSNQNHSIDVAEELQKQPAVKIKKNAEPQVLIYHTHTTEAFLGDTRTTDKSRSVCAVGDEIEKQLKAAGIGVIHDTTYHDYPAYNGSYDRSVVTMANYLKKYPSIQVTLDIHRDAMSRSDGTQLKPTATVAGKKAAQIMIISGCDDTGDLGFPNWEYNLRLAVRLQKSLSDLYPGLARPLDFCARRYNENMTKGSLLVEFGTNTNTLDEAKYSGELFGKSLAAVLNGLT